MGKWCFAGWDGTAQPCGIRGQMSPRLRARSQPGARQPFLTLEQGLALWRKEGSLVPLETGQEKEQVDRADLSLGQTCKTSPGAPRELRGHSRGRAVLAGVQQQDSSTHPGCPSASCHGCNSLMEENLTLPSPGLQGVPLDFV